MIGRIHLKERLITITEIKNGMELKIRRALRKDLDAIWNIFNIVVEEKKYIPVLSPVVSEFEKQSWYLKMREQQNLMLIAIVGEKIVGQLAVEHVDWETCSHVGELGLVILPKYRGLGIGRKLINSCLKIVRNKSLFKKITLSCFHNNHIALNLYKKLGFKEVGRKTYQFFINEEWLDEVLFELIIDTTPPE